MNQNLIRIVAVLTFFISITFLLLSVNPPKSFKNELSTENDEDNDFFKNSSIRLTSLSPEIRQIIRSQIKSRELPKTFSNIKKVIFETQSNSDLSKNLNNSFNQLKNTIQNDKESATLTAILIEEEEHFILLLALEENTSRNRIWESSTKIKKSPTTKM